MQTFSTLFAESGQQLAGKSGQVVEAKVLRIEHDQVILDAGFKSEGVVPIGQFYNEENELEIQENDLVKVVVEHIDGGAGLTALSRERAKRLEAMELIEKAFDEGSVLKGRMISQIRGGYQVEVQGVRAFLPGSLAGGNPRDTHFSEGQVIEFKINALNKEKNNIVISRRAVVDQQSEVDLEEIRARVFEGAVIKGVVKNMTDYGAFVDLGGIDGLLHNLDISWRRIRNPGEVLKVGQEIEVKVLKYDLESNRVSLGVKQLQGDPWDGIEARYPDQYRAKATVTNITNYGFFAELEAGVEGLVHISEISWSNRNVHPSRVVSVGQEIEVMVLGINSENRRMSLGMKQCVENPWEQFAATHQVGDTIQGSISSVTDFGLFVSLDHQIDGLIHNSDIAWHQVDAGKIAELYKKGDEVTAKVIALDIARERISLSIKHLVENPLELYLAEHAVGETVEGTVSTTAGSFVNIQLSETVVGQVRKSELDAMGAKEDEKVELIVAGLEPKRNVVRLSNRAVQAEGAPAPDALERPA